MKKQWGLRLSEDQDKGITLENGAVRTSHGTVIPTRCPRKAKPKEPIKEVQAETPATNRRNYEEVRFETPVGEISGMYGPVVVQDSYVILGLSKQSFIPQPFKKNPDLRLTLKYEGESLQVIYTGCRFEDPETHREYIILMRT